MALHLLYLVSGAGYNMLCGFCLHAICKFIAAKSTSLYRTVLKKLTLCHVITLRDKTMVKDVLCAVHISMLERLCMPICLSLLILKNPKC